MEARIQVVTLAVSDVARALRFYRDGLGWSVLKDYGKYAYVALEGGLRLALCERETAAAELGLPPEAPVPRALLAQNVDAPAKVDAVLRLATAAGATILRPASDRSWGGRAGSFADPDGHVWEAAWNPRI